MVARLLRHSGLKMLTRIYDHTSTEILRKALLGARPAAESKRESYKRQLNKGFIIL
jgi:hypothetical protein